MLCPLCDYGAVATLVLWEQGKRSRGMEVGASVWPPGDGALPGGAAQCGPGTQAAASEVSGGGGLEIVELASGAGDHRRQIRRQHDHVEAALHCSGRKLCACTVHDRLDAVLVCRFADLIAGGEVYRVRIIAPRDHTQRERQVGRPDVHGVEAGCRTYGIQVSEPFLCLNHSYDDDLV